jgi:decaprenylphospho-beta-D-ribofuranose 2-oxidase
MKPKNFERKLLFSYDRSYSADILVTHPDKYREIENLSKLQEDLISVGSNLSYSPLSFDKNSLSVVLKKFNRIIDFDLTKKEVTVEAGMSLADLLNFTLKYNLWIPQLPGYPEITLGGAVATNAHGKSCAVNGTIRNSIKSILIFHKNNGWLNLSDNENKEIFDLTIGGLGLTGSIINITFNLAEIKSKTFLTKKTKVSSLKESINMIVEKSKKKDTFIYSWNIASTENFGKGIIFENIVNEEADDKEKNNQINIKSKKNYFAQPFPIWNKYSIKLVNKLFYYLNTDIKKNTEENFQKVIFPFYGKENYFYFFGKKGFLESQLLIPNNNIDEFLNEFEHLFKLYNPLITLLSFKNLKGHQTLLRFEDNKISLTIDYVNNQNSIKFMKEIDILCEKYEILPSIIKDSRLDIMTFKKCYKDLHNFRQKLNLFDKKRVYKSRTSNRLEI